MLYTSARRVSGHNLAAVKAFPVNYRISIKFQLTESLPAGWAKMYFAVCVFIQS